MPSPVNPDDKDSSSNGGVPVNVIDQDILHGRQRLTQEFLSHETQIDLIHDLATNLLSRYNSHQQRCDLDEAISLYERAIKTTPESDPLLAYALEGLAASLGKRAVNFRQPNDLDEAIKMRQRAVKLIGISSDDDDKRLKGSILQNLCIHLWARYNQTRQEIDLQEMIVHSREALQLMRSPHSDRPKALTSLASALRARFQLSGDLNYLEEAIESHKEALELRPPSHPNHFEYLMNLGSALSTHTQHSGDSAHLIEAIKLHRQAVRFMPHPHPYHTLSLSNLAFALQSLFHQTGEVDHISEVITLHREALRLRPSPHPNRAESLANLATALTAQFQHSGELDNLKEAIAFHREALILRPSPHSSRFHSLTSLAAALQLQFQHSSGVISHLKEAVTLHRQALELTPPPHPYHSHCLANLAAALQAQYVHCGGLDNLKEAIKLHEEALHLRPAPHPNRAESLANLASAFQSLFQNGGGSIHLEKAIEFHEKALELIAYPHPRHSQCLTNLAAALQARFQQSGGLHHLEKAVELQKEALEHRPYPHPDRSDSLDNLATALFTHFQHTGKPNELEDAIKFHRKALELRPEPHPSHSVSISNLALALSTNFQHGGGLIHLEEAIDLYKQALELRPYPHPDYPDSLTSLASVLVSQFRHGGGLNNLQDAIRLHKQALEVLPPQHPYYSESLDMLATALFIQFSHDRKSKSNHLEEAIGLYERALQLRPEPHPKRSDSLNNLASALVTQFEDDGELSHLKKAIVLNRQALAIIPPSHPNHVLSVANLAFALQSQFWHTRELDSLKEALSLIESEIELTSNNDSLADPSPSLLKTSHVQHSQFTLFLALALLCIDAHHTISPSGDYLEKAVNVFSSASVIPTLSPFQRFQVAELWAKHAEETHHHSAMKAYSLAIQLLPQLNPLNHSLKQRQASMVTHRRIQETARGAFQYAIHMQCFDKAIEFLETARGILWSQIGQLRPPFDRLRTSSPELAQRLQEIATELDKASHVDIVTNTRRNILGNQPPHRLASFTLEWQSKLEEVRQIPGFEEFLLPLRVSALQKAAALCPISIPIPHNNGSSCLIMTSVTIYHISIPSFTTDKLQSMVLSLQEAALLNGSKAQNEHHVTNADNITKTVEELPVDTMSDDRLKASRANRKVQNPDVIFRNVLEELWKELVKPVIDILNIEKSTTDSRPIIQWCPTGLFTFLPIHAAGLYPTVPALGTTTDSPADIARRCLAVCASDFIISSYTPTLSALIPPESQVFTPLKDFKMLAIGISKQLPNAEKEIQNIKARIPKHQLIEAGTEGSTVPAHVDTILSHIPTSSIVHFACHGIQDRMNPMESGLALEDGMLTIAQIMKRPLPPGALAFLCACETAMGDEKLPDEAMSIGASLVFSGFRSVVATMWRIMDKHGPTVSDAFYEELLRGPHGKTMLVPDLNRSPQALDIAVQKLRSSGVPFHEWVPFIHMGRAM